MTERLVATTARPFIKDHVLNNNNLILVALLLIAHGFQSENDLYV